MNKEEFAETVACLVAGLQAPVSMGTFVGAARQPWEKLLNLGNKGFGWTNSEQLEAAFREVLGLKPVVTGHEPPAWNKAWPAKCGEGRPCSEAGKWGATGVLPPGHIWQWRDESHTSGYLAHEPAEGQGT